jgi:adenine deaminase
MNEFTVSGVVVLPVKRERFGAHVTVSDGKIVSILPDPQVTAPYIMPGFIDSHVHIESSMLIPSQFAYMAVKHGTVGVVTDPHEVANVAGVSGIRFMVENSKEVPMKFFFGVPSCVPASPLEKSGAVITAQNVKDLINEDDFFFLAEMMNYPGVIYGDKEVFEKLSVTAEVGKPIDGHAPGLQGKDLEAYVKSGITTDHECSNTDEAIEKIKLGQKIQIREGSAARNFNALSTLITGYPNSIMFCTDDCHPDYLENGHINKIVQRAISKGYDLYDVLTIATTIPVEHYKLPIGQLNVGDPADFIVVHDLISFNVKETYVSGVKVFSNESVLFELPKITAPDFSFRTEFPSIDQLKVIAKGSNMNVIEAIPGELLTNWLVEKVTEGEEIQSNIEKDLLKIVLLDRYSNTKPVLGFIKGFGLEKGAIAASIAHDSHHLLAVGVDDESIQRALQWLVESRGGLCFATPEQISGVRLPYYGLMADEQGEVISKRYQSINKQVIDAGCKINAPFMTASFMALTVIPNLKINHNGLFDVNKFCSVPLFH